MVDMVDCIVVGAGVIGLACAATLAASGREVIVLEKEASAGSETSSRNSEVIHAGIYYPSGSLKARFCRDGRDRLYAYCAARGINHKRIGKVIVATRDQQIGKLKAIEVKALANGVSDLQWLSKRELESFEPAVTGTCALFSPSTGIIDSHGLMLALEGDLATNGGIVVLNSPVTSGTCDHAGITLRVGDNDPTALRARTVVNCAGLHAPSLAASLTGLPRAHIPDPYFAKGHYFRMTGLAPFSHLVYPVPEDGGLGVHLTLDLAGRAKFGPDVEWIDEIDYSFDTSRTERFVAAIRDYYPGIDEIELHPDYTGIRPKIAGSGSVDADFRIDSASVHGIPGLINLFGIESPGLTASLAIADHVASLA